jgi:hypothetical protein
MERSVTFLKIARTVIKDGNLLRVLGFKKRKGGRTPRPPVVVTSEKALPASDFADPALLALPGE